MPSTNSLGNVGPVQPSAGKGRSGSGQTGQHSSTHMGSNRNNQVAQNKSRLSNNDPNDIEDSEGESSDEDKLREEPPDMRVYPEFLKNLPGV